MTLNNTIVVTKNEQKNAAEIKKTPFSNEEKTNQDSFIENSKHKDDLDSHSFELKKTMENLGYGDLKFEEFIEIKPNPNSDQSEASQLIEAQSLARQILDGKKQLLDDDALINLVSSEQTTDAVQIVCYRIIELRSKGDLIAADKLIDKLKKIGKEFGATAKTIDTILEKSTPEVPKRQKKHDLPFEILGFNKERKILLWHRGHQMNIPVLSLQNELKLFLGPDNVTDEIVNEIISLAHEKNIIDEEEPLKIGIWQLREWKKEGKILILSGRGGLFFNGGKFTKLEGPVVEDQIVNFEKRPWIDLDALMKAAPDIKQTYNLVRKILAEWPWKIPDMADWMAALVMLLPFQQLMRWRPWLWLDGASNSGKSAFFEEFLEHLYRFLLKRADKATAHSVAQGVGNTSKIPILDEFEKFKHNEEVLNMCKIMNRGGTKTTGTPGDKELTFNLHHIPIFGSIYLPRTLVSDQSQRNRIIRFSLDKVQKGKRKKAIPDEKLNQLGLDIVASMIPKWGEIEEKSKLIQNKTEEIVASFGDELSSRAVENFMYAAALLEIVTGKSHTVPEWARQEQIDDGRTIIEAIIRAKVRSDIGDFLIGDLILCVATEGNSKEANITPNTARNILRLNGLSVVNSKKNNLRMLALQPEMVSKEVLKNDPDFKGLDISEPLLRLSGSQRAKTSMGGSKHPTVQVPLSLVMPYVEVSHEE